LLHAIIAGKQNKQREQQEQPVRTEPHREKVKNMMDNDYSHHNNPRDTEKSYQPAQPVQVDCFGRRKIIEYLYIMLIEQP